MPLLPPFISLVLDPEMPLNFSAGSGHFDVRCEGVTRNRHWSGRNVYGTHNLTISTEVDNTIGGVQGIGIARQVDWTPLPVGCPLVERTVVQLTVPTIADVTVSSSPEGTMWVVHLSEESATSTVILGCMYVGLVDDTVVSLHFFSPKFPVSDLAFVLDPAQRISATKWGNEISIMVDWPSDDGRPGSMPRLDGGAQGEYHEALDGSLNAHVRDDGIFTLTIPTSVIGEVNTDVDSKPIEQPLEARIDFGEPPICTRSGDGVTARIDFPGSAPTRWVAWDNSAAVFGLEASGRVAAIVVTSAEVVGHATVDNVPWFDRLIEGSPRVPAVLPAPVYVLSGRPPDYFQDEGLMTPDTVSITYGGLDDSDSGPPRMEVRSSWDAAEVQGWTSEQFRKSSFIVGLVWRQVEVSGAQPEDFGRDMELVARSLPIEKVDLDVDGKLHEFEFIRLELAWIAAAVINKVLVVIEGSVVPLGEISLVSIDDLEQFEHLRLKSDELRAEHMQIVRAEYERDQPLKSVANRILWCSPWHDSDTEPTDGLDTAIVESRGGTVQYVAALDLYEATCVSSGALFGEPIRSEDGARATIDTYIDRGWVANRYGAHPVSAFVEPTEDDLIVGEECIRFPLRLELRGDEWIVTTDLLDHLERGFGTLDKLIQPAAADE